MKTYFVGVDLGGTNIKAGVTAPDGRVLSKLRIPTEAAKGPHAVTRRIALAARQAVGAAAVDWADIAGVGVGSPGTIDLEAGVVTFCPNLRGLEGFALRDAVSRELGNVPVILENDANAAAKGEEYAGAGHGAHSLVMFTLGTGVGGGIVINGSVWHGSSGVGSEIGHMSIDMNGPRCNCGNYGCIEVFASATAMVRRMKEAIKAGAETILASEVETITAKRIHEAALSGDGASLENIAQTGRYLGVAVSNVLYMMNPEVVVLSGGVIGAGDMLMDPLKDEVRKRTVEACLVGTSIRFAELGEDAGFIGAAGCAMVAFGT